MEKATALLLSIIMLLLTPAAASNESAGDSLFHRIVQLIVQQESDETSFAITRGGVSLRSAPNLMAKTTARVDGGTSVQILQTKTTGGVQWARIRSGSAEGWVRLRLLTIVDSHITPENTACTKEAFDLYASPSQSASVVAKLNQGESVQMIQTEYYASIRWAFVEAPSKGVSGWIPCEVLELPQSWKESYSIPGYARMGVINTSRLNIRLAPGTNNLRIGSYGYGQRIGVLEIQGEWGRTNRGWIYLPYTYLDGNLGQHPMVGNVTATQLNVRSGPGTGYRAVATVGEGTRVLVLEQITVGSMVWGYTRAGWVCMSYVQPDYIPGTTTPIYGYGYFAQNEALHGGAGSSNPVVGTIPAGSLTPIWSVVSAEGGSWGQTPNGWVNMAHVNMSEVYKHLNPPPKPVPGIPCIALSADSMGELTAAGQTWQLKVTASPVNTTDALTYASKNPTVVTVNGNGLVTAVGEGTTAIVITCGSKQIEVAATVKFPEKPTEPDPTVPCTALVADPMSEFTAAGQTQQLKVTASPNNTTDTVTYSSDDPAVVSVDGNGLVTAVSEGSTTIVITCGNQRIEVAATVKFPEKPTEPDPTVSCTALTADPTEVLLTAADQTQQLTVTPTPADTTDTITYISNDTAVVTVDEKGLVAAVGEGSTIIVITCGDQRVEVPVTVKFPSANIPCTALSADLMDELTAVGETQQLTVTPTPADTTDTITYASNDTTIVTVDEKGLVTAVGEGSTTIVITCGDQGIEVPVTVKFPSADIPCTALAADSTVELTTTDLPRQLNVTVSPADTTDTVGYTSNNTSVVTVDEKGLVTVVAEGSTSITVTCGSQKIDVPVTVKAPTVSCDGLTVTPTSGELTPMQTLQLQVTASPTNTTDAVTFASSNPAIANVDGSGLVTAAAVGDTSIVITCGSKQVNVPVTVKAPTVPCTALAADPIGEFTEAGQMQQLKVTVSPTNTTDTITYASDNPAVVTVGSDGVVTSMGEGNAIITVTCGGQQATVTAVVNFPDPQPDPQPEPPAEPDPPAGSGDAIEPKEVIELSTEQTTVSTVELTAAGQTKQLKVTLSPTDNPDTLTFTSNDPAVVTVDGSGLITVVGEGSTVVVITCGEKQIEVPIVVKFQ